ncbi:MAG: hypothetical protein AAGF97_11970 [Planctomycetota bacterium]
MNDLPANLDAFLITRGGPFYELQKRLRLLHEHNLNVRRRAMLFVALAWGGPLVLSLLEGHAWGGWDEHPFLLELAVWARFVVAMGIFVLMEPHVEGRLRTILHQFSEAKMLGAASYRLAAEAVSRALDRQNAFWPELVCVLLAYTISLGGAWLRLRNGTMATGWMATDVDGAVQLTLAGWWCFLISNPLFIFLLFRWFWRMQVWSWLLASLAQLDLRLVATHPDGLGGLGFVVRYPNAYTMLVFAVSCVLGSALMHVFLDHGVSMQAYGIVIGGWLLLVVGLFTYPLLAFWRPLARLRKQTLLLAGAKSTTHLRHAERQVLGRNVCADDPSYEQQLEGNADATASFVAATKLSTLLIRRSELIPISLAASVPLILAGASQWPLKELAAILKKLVLL